MTTITKPKPKKITSEVEFAQIESGDLMAITSFVEVESVTSRGPNGQPTLSVVDRDNGQKFQVIGKPLIERAQSADRFLRTETKTKTELAEILTTSWNRPLTVVFEKQDGAMRTLRGRLIQPEHLLGRSHVQDLDAARQGGDATDGMRLVDHRTIESLIVGGVKYTLRKK
jgi:hypothetical protein